MMRLVYRCVCGKLTATGPVKDKCSKCLVVPMPADPDLSRDEQTRHWVNGTSLCPNAAGECCPDFSCCRPKLRWAKAKRETFAAVGQAEREKMLLGALVGLVKAVDPKARVIG